MARHCLRPTCLTSHEQIIGFLLIGLLASGTVCGLPAKGSDVSEQELQELQGLQELQELKNLEKLKELKEVDAQTESESERSEAHDIFSGANCGVPTTLRGNQVLSKRIVGGMASIHGEWPWLATLQLLNHTSGNYEHLCGGTLIHPQWVISVAHCFEKVWAPFLTQDPEEWMVRLGEHNLLDNLEQHIDVKVDKIILHPKRDIENLWSYDIALLKLQQPVTLNRFVNLACVPLDEEGFHVGQSCKTVGWGHTSEGGQMSPILRHVSVPIIDPEYCRNAYEFEAEKYGVELEEDTLCAGALGKGGRDACQYDSGGPMLCRKEGRYYVYGLVSTGLGCARKEFPGIYTRVPKHIPWISQTLMTE